MIIMKSVIIKPHSNLVGREKCPLYVDAIKNAMADRAQTIGSIFFIQSSLTQIQEIDSRAAPNAQIPQLAEFGLMCPEKTFLKYSTQPESCSTPESVPKNIATKKIFGIIFLKKLRRQMAQGATRRNLQMQTRYLCPKRNYTTQICQLPYKKTQSKALIRPDPKFPPQTVFESQRTRNQ